MAHSDPSSPSSSGSSSAQQRSGTRSAEPQPDVQVAKRSLVLNVLAYTGARLLIVVVVVAILLGAAALLDVTIPLIVALAIGVVIQLPLSYVLLARLRVRLTGDLDVVGARRREDKAHLRAQLRGDG